MTTNAEIADYLQDEAQWQALFEKEWNIPSRGRSRYQQWLANQWQVPASEYALRGAGVGMALPRDAETDEVMSYADYIAERRAGGGPPIDTHKPRQDRVTSRAFGFTPGQAAPSLSRMYAPGEKSGYYSRGLGGMAPGAYRETVETLPQYVPQAAFYSEAAQKYAPFFARGLARQAYRPEVRREFELDPEGATKGTFLDFLRTRYGMGTKVGLLPEEWDT